MSAILAVSVSGLACCLLIVHSAVPMLSYLRLISVYQLRAGCVVEIVVRVEPVAVMQMSDDVETLCYNRS